MHTCTDSRFLQFAERTTESRTSLHWQLLSLQAKNCTEYQSMGRAGASTLPAFSGGWDNASVMLIMLATPGKNKIQYQSSKSDKEI